MSGVYPIIEGDEPAAEAGENDVRILSAFDIISAETTAYQIDFPGGGVSDKLIEPRPISQCTSTIESVGYENRMSGAVRGWRLVTASYSMLGQRPKPFEQSLPGLAARSVSER